MHKKFQIRLKSEVLLEKNKNYSKMNQFFLSKNLPIVLLYSLPAFSFINMEHDYRGGVKRT